MRYHFFYETVDTGNIILTRVRVELPNKKFIEQVFDTITGLPLTAEKQEAL
jgi:hypothetical protein